VRSGPLIGLTIVACAAAPAAPKPVTHETVDAAAIEEASVVDASVIEASTSQAMHCDPPHVRDSVTLECTDHAPCAADEDLVSGTCMPTCGAPFGYRDAQNGCTCAPGLTRVSGAEFGGCVKPGDLDFSKMCTRPHQHFDGSIVPTCKCDAGYVEHSSGGLGMLNACIRACKAPLAYDSASDRCTTCAPRDVVFGVCTDKCPSGSKREPSSGECFCSGGMFLDHGKCVHCMPDRVWDGATNLCNCPAGTEDWGYEGCFAACPSGEHHLHQRCVADCSGAEANDDKTGACAPCDPSQNAFATTTHGHATCTRCSFDEVLGKTGECECRPTFRRANGHCVNP
jgi:hypothetical protein